MTSLHVSALTIYPVKGCRGIALRTTEVSGMGFRYDRRWMVVDENNTFLTQRSHPALATIRTAIRDGAVHLHADDAGSVSFPCAQEPSGNTPVAVWESTVLAYPVAGEVGAWMSDILDQRVRVVGIPEGPSRPVDPVYSRPGDFVGFADGFPVLVLSEASLRDLNGRMEVPLPMDRFRPNLVVDGAEPFGEDGWTRLETARTSFRLVKRCARCEVTTVDQETGIAGKEPLRTLATYRAVANKVYFGVNAIPDRTGLLSVGDDVTVG